MTLSGVPPAFATVESTHNYPIPSLACNLGSSLHTLPMHTEPTSGQLYTFWPLIQGHTKAAAKQTKQQAMGLQPNQADSEPVNEGE